MKLPLRKMSAAVLHADTVLLLLPWNSWLNRSLACFVSVSCICGLDKKFMKLS